MTDHRGLVIGSGTSRALVFLPGFLAPAGGYRDLVAPLARDDPGLRVHIPQLYRRGLSALAGGRPVREEAQAAAEVAARLAAAGHAVWLGGHSRGGQAAWLAAEALSRSRVPVAGLMLVDPVDGSGPGSGPTTTTGPAGFAVAPLIVGAGLGGRCAPAALGHRAFAASAAAAATEPDPRRRDDSRACRCPGWVGPHRGSSPVRRRFGPGRRAGDRHGADGCTHARRARRAPRRAR